ncbi:MupA/Atu3671 family FMN-dependent luciferase-like monooxygenase [Nocardia sp. NPDC050193]
MNSDAAVAVVGMAGRFPGAADIGQFWRNLTQERESLVRSDPQPGTGRSSAYGVLADVDMFDAGFFAVPPAEAELLDPQHRLFLECVWQALEHAGCPPDRYGPGTGIFASSSISSYLLDTLLPRFRSAGPVERHRMLLGGDKDFLATRVSYKLDLQGPSIAVQTGCSSSLVALHLAVQSLAAGDCDVAVVGSATVSLPQATTQEHVEGAIVSGDGYCRPFDAAASGTVGGNGVAAVVLRRVRDAVRDGNPVRAVVLGSAVVNDGHRKVGFAAPGFDGQVRTVSRALQRAGLSSSRLGFVEAHGTGTPMGDPIEVSALAEAFSRHRAEPADPGTCFLGSVKSNIGHLDATAGVAGLIKAVLALEHGVIPATLHFSSPNPAVDWDRSPFAVNGSTVEWAQARADRRCGVSSLGIGGTNAHVVLAGWEDGRRTGSRSCHVLTYSAHSRGALEQREKELVDYLDNHPAHDPADIAFTSQVGSQSLPHRKFVVGDSRSGLIEAFDATTAAAVTTSRSRTVPAVSFLFPGQGAQYPALGLPLWSEFDLFRTEHDRCLDLIEAAAGIPVRERLYGDEPSDLDDTVLVQPALFAVEYALAQTWLQLGIRPASMAGHSIGEYVAAVVAGVMTVEDAVELVAVRAQLMQELPPGAMLAVAVSEAETARFVEAGADLAAVNGPTSCVLSVPDELVATLTEDLTAAGTPFRKIPVSRAFHSRMIDSCLDGLRAQLERTTLRPPAIPFTSGVTGRWITDEEATSPEYWVQQTRSTVRFADQLGAVLETSPDLLIELGPGRVLSRLARRDSRKPADSAVLAALPAANDDESEAFTFSQALAQVWQAGAPVDWAPLWGETGRRVDLPPYPFQRSRHWASDVASDGPADPVPVSGPVSVERPARRDPSTDDQPEADHADELVTRVRAAYAKAIGTTVEDTADFFEVGGDSLVAVQIVLALREELGRELSLRDFVSNPTINGLVTVLAAGQSTAASTRPAPPAPAATGCPVSLRERPAAPSRTPTVEPTGLQFSVFFFSADSDDSDRYGLIRECAQRADELGYTAIWTPERHFHQFGDLYPNPSVLAAGLATITNRIQLRAGSVVAPLHHPARVAEEWSIVDNLSGGRVGLGFAPGFLPLDFVFGQASFQRKQQVALERIDKVRRLWRGESIEDINGVGERVTIRTFPQPVQPELPVWMTASANPETFALAGRSGFNLLTALINLDLTELEERIAVYRRARAEHGFDPETGTVTVMMHAFVGEGDDAAVRAVVEQPFRRYLWANSEIIRSAAKSVLDGLDIDKLTPSDRETLMDFAFRRYWKESALLGSAETVAARAERLTALGVDEVACLIDFGLDRATVVAGLERLAAVIPRPSLLHR